MSTSFNSHLAYFYLVSPLHTGGSSQEGNLVGIARESHTDLPYLPSSTIRGRLRASTDSKKISEYWGNTIEDVSAGIDDNLTQGSFWIGDAAILWFPVPSLSHGTVWISSPALLKRWARWVGVSHDAIPAINSFSKYKKDRHLYLRDAIFTSDCLTHWQDSEDFVPKGCKDFGIMDTFLVLSEQSCSVLIEASLWRQVKIRLDENKSVNGGFRSEEAIPPETLLYFPFGSTSTAKNSNPTQAIKEEILGGNDFVQFGGLESLGRGFGNLWIPALNQKVSSVNK
ncbi:MAG: type III-B CRISPR module RAMP protein Cmr4 [Pseudanabaena sp. ELA645]|jgi:CRISPR-associated protein Cmr4